MKRRNLIQSSQINRRKEIECTTLGIIIHLMTLPPTDPLRSQTLIPLLCARKNGQSTSQPPLSSLESAAYTLSASTYPAGTAARRTFIGRWSDNLPLATILCVELSYSCLEMLLPMAFIAPWCSYSYMWPLRGWALMPVKTTYCAKRRLLSVSQHCSQWGSVSSRCIFVIRSWSANHSCHMTRIPTSPFPAQRG